jgi:hypothetical protein
MQMGYEQLSNLGAPSYKEEAVVVVSISNVSK